MTELAKYESYYKKLQGICDENNLVFAFRKDVYPIRLTIKPAGGMDAQLSMLEMAEDKGYTSPDAFLSFYIKDGELAWKTSRTFTIGDALFAKLKNLYKNLHYYWLQYFFRDLVESDRLDPRLMPAVEDSEMEPIEEDIDDLAEEMDMPDSDSEIEV